MTKMDTKVLAKLIRMTKGKLPVARVGILGRTNSRDGKKGNAEIGAKHEFGHEGMPVRSFLRVPIAEHYKEYLQKSGAFDEDAIKNALAEGTLVPWMKKVGIIAEAIVSDGFDTGGFGKWEPSNMEIKKNKQTLVETQQLRNSITSEVVE